MFETSSPAYQAWKGIGRDIKRHRPKGLVVVSAHWENDQQSSGVKGEFEVYWVLGIWSSPA